MKFSKSAESLSELTNNPYALSATKAKTSSHRSMLTFPEPYSTCGVEADPEPDVDEETVLGTVGGEDVVRVVNRMVVVTVGRNVVTGLSRVEGRYVNQVGIR